MSAPLLDSYIPHRKPLPAHSAVAAYHPASSDQEGAGSAPQRAIPSSSFPQTEQRPLSTMNLPLRHPPQMYNQQQQYAPYHPHQGPALTHSSYSTMTSQQPNQSQNRRTLSNATASTSSTGSSLHHGQSRHQYTASQSSASAPIRRSSSSRSGASTSSTNPTSYVALLRKQKATVWCDRSQASDPRLRLQQRIARERAAGEIGTGGSLRGGATPPMGASSASEGRTFTGTGNLARKIRHHGAARTVQVGTVTGVGGVPMRLSATEVDDDEEDDYAHSYSMARQGVHNHKEEAEDWLRPGAQHRRADSGRSVGSAGHKPNQTYQPGHSRSPSDSIPHIAEEDTVAGPPYSASGPSYYPTGSLANARSRNGSRRSRTSSGSGGSGDQRERENSFGSMGPLREADSEATKNSQQESLDELKRRGSVDERAMTMSGRGVRLFVANPDLSD